MLALTTQPLQTVKNSSKGPASDCHESHKQLSMTKHANYRSESISSCISS